MNLSLVLLVLKTYRSFPSLDVASQTIIKIHDSYVPKWGLSFVFNYLTDGSFVSFIDVVTKGLNQRGNTVLLLYDETKPPRFKQPSGVLLFLDFSSTTYANQLNIFLSHSYRLLHWKLRVIIVLLQASVLSDADVESIMEKLHRSNLRNVLVLTVDLEESFNTDMKLFYKASDYNVNANKAIRSKNIKTVVFSPDEGQKVSDIIREISPIPDVIDINGTQLNISAVTTPPYVGLIKTRWANLISMQQESFTSNNIRGLDILIIRELQEKHNLTGYYILEPTGVVRFSDMGGELDKGYATTTSGMERGLAELAIGGHHPHSRLYNRLSASTYYFYDKMYWYVPGGKEMVGWRGFFATFDTELWLLILAAYLLTVAGIYISARIGSNGNNGYDISTVVMLVGATLLNQSVATQKMSGSLKMIFYFSVLYGLHISTFYQSSVLISLTRKDYETPVSSIEEALDLNMDACVPKISYQFYRFTRDVLFRSKRNVRVSLETDFIECLDRVVETRRQFALMPARVAEYMIPMRYLDKDRIPLLSKIPKELVTYPVSMYLRKGSIYEKHLNLLLSSLNESGILIKWWNEAQFRKLLMWRKMILKVRIYNSISLENSSEIFLVPIILLIGSCLVFTLELTWHKIMTLKKQRTRG